MKVQFIWLTLVLMLMDSILANPLLENGLATRTFFQQNMKCNTKSAFKRITMSHSIFNAANSQSCGYTIRAYNTKVCQVRIDFRYMVLDPPAQAIGRPYAHCGGGRLTISGMEFDLCGTLINQHVYVPFYATKLTDEIVLNFNTGSNSMAIWDMEVNQIECSYKSALVTPDEKEAPTGCLQYFYQPTGRVESFNYGQYYGDTHYAICFNRNHNDNAMLELSDISFEMDGGGLGFDGDCLDNDPTNPKDYIAIPFAQVADPLEDPHSLFCLNSLDMSRLTYRGAGPIVIHVNTDRIDGNANGNPETGFSFTYRVR